jgi:hypothetical protein
MLRAPVLLSQSLQPIHLARSLHWACNTYPISPACKSRRGSAALSLVAPLQWRV